MIVGIATKNNLEQLANLSKEKYEIKFANVEIFIQNCVRSFQVPEVSRSRRAIHLCLHSLSCVDLAGADGSAACVATSLAESLVSEVCGRGKRVRERLRYHFIRARDEA